MSTRAIEQACFELLSSRSISYRFPRIRARQIALCWHPFLQIKDEYHDFVNACGNEEAARRQVVETFPGIGLKQASMFLRNIGASKSLSVVDVHTLFYLRACHGVEIGHLTSKQYIRAEELLRRAATEHDLAGC
jgi:N-glycosylase/DNA lyase